MGYTHYWSRENAPHDEVIWNQLVTDCKTLYKHLPSEVDGEPLLLNGCFRYKNATFNKSLILFNGTHTTVRTKSLDGCWEDAERGQDLGHETFALTRKVQGDRRMRNNKYAFLFCKTGHKPYDLMVTACLILYKYYFYDAVQVSSDGDMEDYSPAFKLIGTVLPYGRILALDNELGEFKLFESLPQFKEV